MNHRENRVFNPRIKCDNGEKMADIYTLGAGTPTPTPTRFGSSHVLKLGEQLLMFDCGPAATHKLVKAGLFPTQVDYLFLHAPSFRP